MLLNFTKTRNTTAADTNWFNVESFKPCWHEAGHAVIARVEDFPVAWVSIDQAFIKTNPLAIENECSSSPAVCMTLSSDRMIPIIKKRTALNIAAKETVIGYCMHVLAGPFVEESLDYKYFDPRLSGGDYEQVQRMLNTVEPRKAAKKS